MNPVSKSICLSVAGFFLFSIGDAARKLLLQDYGVFDVQFWVTLAAAIGILFYAPKLGGLRSLLNFRQPGLLFAKSCLTTGLALSVLAALKSLDMTTFYAIALLAPLTTLLLARLFFHEPVGLYRSLLVATGFAGVLLVLRPGVQGFNPGVAFAFLGMILFSCNNLLSKLIPQSDPKLPFGFYPSILTAFVSFVLVAGRPDAPAAGDAWIIIVAGLCSVTGIVFLIKAFQLASAGIPAPFHYTQIIWGTVFGFTLFESVPDVWTVCGSAVIVISGLALYCRTWQKPAATRLL